MALACALFALSAASSDGTIAAPRAAELGLEVALTEPAGGYVGRLDVAPVHGPAGTPLKVTRIADQDPAFLRFIEQHDLKPGQPIEVERRADAADSVLVRGKDRRAITIGARAASKLLVEIVSS